MKKIWQIFKEQDLFAKIVLVLTLLTILFIIVVQIRSGLTDPSFSMIDFMKWTILLPIIVLGFIILIIWNGKIVTRFVNYRHDISVPRWLRILAWILFALLIIARLRLLF